MCDLRMPDIKKGFMLVVTICLLKTGKAGIFLLLLAVFFFFANKHQVVTKQRNDRYYNNAIKEYEKENFSQLTLYFAEKTPTMINENEDSK